MSELSVSIEAAWEKRELLGAQSKGAERDAVEAALECLDNGSLRVAEKIDGEWKVREWLKKAVLLSFRLNDMKLIAGAPGEAVWWDKVIPNSSAGTRPNSAPRAFAPCLVRWCAARLSSPRARC